LETSKFFNNRVTESSVTVQELIVNNKTVKDSVQVANAFNEFFVDIGKNIQPIELPPLEYNVDHVFEI